MERKKIQNTNVGIKRIPSTLWVYDYIYDFKYTTKRGNEKTQKRILTDISKESADFNFKIWVDIFNDDFSYRAMLNVEILSVECTKGRLIYL